MLLQQQQRQRQRQQHHQRTNKNHPPSSFLLIFCLVCYYAVSSSSSCSSLALSTITTTTKTKSFMAVKNAPFSKRSNSYPFLFNTIPTKRSRKKRTCLPNSSSSSNDNESSSSPAAAIIINPELIQAAKVKLTWEILEETYTKPVLDLSSLSNNDNDLSLSEQTLVMKKNTNSQDDQKKKAKDDDNNEKEEQEEWEDGSTWYATRQGLVKLKVLPDYDDDDDDDYNPNNDYILKSAPQLLRLDTNAVLNSTSLLLQQYNFSPSSLLSSSSDNDNDTTLLITYPSQAIEYGINFLQNMMALPSSSLLLPLLRSNHKFFVEGIEGGLQELSVKKALGDASDAMYGANRRVAMDSANVLKGIRNRGNGGGGGGGDVL